MPKFDITKHKWSDSNISSASTSSDIISTVIIDTYGFRQDEAASIEICESDAIAIAKHFNLIKDEELTFSETLAKDFGAKFDKGSRL